ncbi:MULTISPECIES: aminodeoxychorismate lyase [Stutzerimonas]|uniref:Aminodeoxychorismate lyase n=1 Tax=Stutzerimonas chloritidismutans TaxID=203192 RepID=A0ABU9M3C0_STUCH|nr:aminodeoxychorismate lyase [Stutzerimonas xanthomarina]MBU0810923.1 aminodeoxychorismate lyase [Gammaproteobacteria bacterium]HAQ88126.1 aminodeoxychorismate lyase [Pseudomonas sp.]MBK3847081.1 aminodeoxychorismate lyase [Stutzerimonas xanthomarina]MBU0852525.1 aminodeoxychorismate lyase [Gammaproteobacteria bacterium]MBU1302561.1 aminodeoxychorismate lyase [Gammaproteobacteria bacterium]
MSWVDGQPAEGLPIHDRGLAYGDGLFETIKVVGGQPELLDRHLQRLTRGCQRLAIPCDIDLLNNNLSAFCAELGRGVAKLIVSRGEGRRGYAPPIPCRPRIVLTGSPLPDYPNAHAEQGVRLFPCTTRLAEQPILAGLKHLNRLEQVLARAEWQDSVFAEGLMRDSSGRVIEGVFSNLFIVDSDRLMTPSLERCGVAGVMREEVLERAQQAGVSTHIGDLSLDQLHRADEVFMCNSLYGIWPVRQLDASVWPVGPVTRKLQCLVNDLSSNT